ncbi:MAG: ABC transporter permease [Clostridia bacterium]|nr:ABC transporter permease [Clostridia bacterium]
MSDISVKNEYTPVKEDFELLEQRDINTDKNFASQSYWKGVAIHFFRNRRAVVGLVIVAMMILLAVFAPMLSGYQYDISVKAPNEKGKMKKAIGIPPRVPAIHEMVTGEKYDDIFSDLTLIFGTDDNGRDLWTRVWHGARVSLLIAFVTIIIDMIIGMSYGLISGYFGGMTDNIMQRIVEIANSIPRLVIVSVLAIFMAKGISLVIVALLLTEWIGMSKIARAEMLKMKEQEYVLASRTLGARNGHIIFKEILPNTIGPIITQVMFSIPTAIFTEAFLSFVGVGIVPPECSIGTLISDGFNNITTLTYQIIPPIIVLALLMLGFNFIGDGLREALAPKLEDM